MSACVIFQSSNELTTLAQKKERERTEIYTTIQQERIKKDEEAKPPLSCNNLLKTQVELQDRFL